MPSYRFTLAVFDKNCCRAYRNRVICLRRWIWEKPAIIAAADKLATFAAENFR